MLNSARAPVLPSPTAPPMKNIVGLFVNAFSSVRYIEIINATFVKGPVATIMRSPPAFFTASNMATAAGSSPTFT